MLHLQTGGEDRDGGGGIGGGGFIDPARDLERMAEEGRNNRSIVDENLERNIGVTPGIIPSHTGLTTISYFPCYIVQGSTNRRAPGLVNFVLALAYHFCLNLPATFTQPGAHLLVEPCTYLIQLSF